MDVSSLIAFIGTLGITFPELSVTTPVSVADSNCANPAVKLSATHVTHKHVRKARVFQSW